MGVRYGEYKDFDHQSGQRRDHYKAEYKAVPRAPSKNKRPNGFYFGNPPLRPDGHRRLGDLAYGVADTTRM